MTPADGVAGIRFPESDLMLPPTVRHLGVQTVMAVLEHGTIDVHGRLIAASNLTLAGVASLDGVDVRVVYKPTAGERPLWDFPDGTLGRREVAMFLLSSLLAPGAVPPTAWRENGPMGGGMCQAFIDPDDGADPLIDVVSPDEVPTGWLAIVEAFGTHGERVVLAHADDARLRRLALIDAVANNGDRKGGHVLVDVEGHAWGIDHGVTFAVEPKLRTVLWGWADEEITGEERQVLLDVMQVLPASGIEALLSGEETAATLARIEALLQGGRMPLPSQEWPALPWPAF